MSRAIRNPFHSTASRYFGGRAGPRRPGRVLPVLLVGVLLLCHGVLGFTHRIPHGCDASHVQPIAAHKHPAGHTDGHGLQDSACGHALTGYFAVLLALIGATFVGILRGLWRRRNPVAVSKSSLWYPSPAFAHPPRGPTLPRLQVFRL